MATYSCEQCGMSVNITCAQCGKALVDDSLTKDDGSAVQISKCPEGHGKIKSPLCCGADMSCPA
jgi:DNA-directed RNA polymerase subunit RPC12/RpoP